MTLPQALIVEDDERLSEIFATAVRAANYEVTIAQDGREALSQLDQIIPDLVVLDLHLPHVMGPEIKDKLKANDRFQQTRVIIATADARLADEMRAEELFILLKPVSVAQLNTLATRLYPNHD